MSQLRPETAMIAGVVLNWLTLAEQSWERKHDMGYILPPSQPNPPASHHHTSSAMFHHLPALLPPWYTPALGSVALVGVSLATITQRKMVAFPLAHQASVLPQSSFQYFNGPVKLFLVWDRQLASLHYKTMLSFSKRFIFRKAFTNLSFCNLLPFSFPPFDWHFQWICIQFSSWKLRMGYWMIMAAMQ